MMRVNKKFCSDCDYPMDYTGLTKTKINKHGVRDFYPIYKCPKCGKEKVQK